MGYGGSMETIERRVAREARVMTKQQVMLEAINGEITWIQAADILGVTARHMRRMRLTLPAKIATAPVKEKNGKWRLFVDPGCGDR